MSVNALMSVYQYKQISWYTTKVVEAFYMQDLKLMERALEVLKGMCEKSQYHLDFKYRTRLNTIPDLSLIISKESNYTLANIALEDRMAYLMIQIEEQARQNAIAENKRPPKKELVFTFSGSTEWDSKPEQEVKQEVQIEPKQVVKPEPVKVQEPVPEPKKEKKLKIVNGKLVQED